MLRLVTWLLLVGITNPAVRGQSPTDEDFQPVSQVFTLPDSLRGGDRPVEYLKDGVSCKTTCNNETMAEGADCNGQFQAMCYLDHSSHHKDVGTYSFLQCLGHWSSERYNRTDTDPPMQGSGIFCNGAFQYKRVVTESKRHRKKEHIAVVEYGCAVIYSLAMTTTYSKTYISESCQEAETHKIITTESRKDAGIYGMEGTTTRFLGDDQYSDDMIEPLGIVQTDILGMSKKPHVSVHCNKKKVHVDGPCDGYLELKLKWKHGVFETHGCHGIWLPTLKLKDSYSCIGTWSEEAKLESKKEKTKGIIGCKGHTTLSHISHNHHSRFENGRQCIGQASSTVESKILRLDTNPAKEEMQRVVYVS